MIVMHAFQVSCTQSLARELSVVYHSDRTTGNNTFICQPDTSISSSVLKECFNIPSIPVTITQYYLTVHAYVETVIVNSLNICMYSAVRISRYMHMLRL